MDRKTWPWRKKSNNTTTSKNTAFRAALDVSHLNSASEVPASTASPSLENPTNTPAESLSTEKNKPLLLLENAKGIEALKEQAEQKVKVLTEKLENAEGDMISTEAMVQQHCKVAEEAVSGWERTEAEVVSLKQELSTTIKQRTVMESRVLELDEALKGCMRQLRHVQEEQQQKMQEVLDKKTQEWSKMKAEMERVEEDLKQRILVAEARSCAMAKSLEERAKAIAEWQEGKEKAEMEAGLLQVKLESQSTEMAALKYELCVLSKEIDIRNQENECSRKTAEAAHKQHLEDVKKITKLDAECQRLHTLVRKRLPGPAAIAQMRMEVQKSEQSKRRSLGSANSTRAHLTCHQGTNTRENAIYCKDMAAQLFAMEEETKILKEILARKTAELQSARQMCARTANKLSVAEEQLESLQGTPTSVRSTQTSALESFLQHSQAADGANFEKLDDEVSCAESWASALINELAYFKNAKQLADSSCFNSGSDNLYETPLKLSNNGTAMPKQASVTDSSVSAQDYTTLKILASKDAQLQSANLMCKDAMAKLVSAEVKLGGTWISENPKSNVEESVHSVGEVHGIMSKLDLILDDMRIAVASVGDTTDDDNSDNGLSSPQVNGQPKSIVAVDASSDLASLKEQVGMQAKEISEMQMQVGTLEAAKAELQNKLHMAEGELNLIRPDLEQARMQIEDLKSSALNLQSEQRKLLIDEETNRAKLEAQLEAEQGTVTKLESSIVSLTTELADRQKELEVATEKCEALDLRLQSYMGRRHNVAAPCRFEGGSDARARKEMEVVAAKEKLSECQRTILVLGKQLAAFSSASSTSFDSSTMPLHYEPLDSSQAQEVDHAHKVHVRNHQRRAFAHHSLNPHDGSTCLPANPTTHTPDIAKPVQLNASLYSKPRRIHSDLSCRTASTNHVPVAVQYSVAEHLQMDDGMSSFYDSLPESAISSPSSLYTSPSDKFRTERPMDGQGGGGARMNSAKSLECAMAMAAANDKRGRGDACIKTGRQGNPGAAGGYIAAKNGGGGGGTAAKASKGFSRFFGRAKK